MRLLFTLGLGLVFYFYNLDIALCQYQFENAVIFNKANGLPANSASSIVEDEHGFLWIGTSDGLCRFDGNQFRIIRKKPDDPNNSLLHNRISSLVLHEGKLWIATRKGVSVLDIATDQFTNYSFDLAGNPVPITNDRLLFTHLVYKDHLDEIWIGTRGLGFGKYDAAKDTFEFFTYKGNEVASTVATPTSVLNVLSFEAHRQNDSILWVGTSSGLLEFNRYTKALDWHYFPQEDKELEIRINAFRRLHHHTDGKLYFGTWHTMVNIFDPVDKQIEIINWKEKLGPSFITGSVSNIRHKSEDELWITFNTDLLVYNTTIKQVTAQWRKSKDSDRHYGANFVDSKNRFWKYDYNGLHMYNPILQQFATHSYKFINPNGHGFARKIIARENESILTICAQDADALYHYHRAERKWTKTAFPTGFYDPEGQIFGFDMVEAQDSTLTISLRTKLAAYDPAKDRITELSYKPQLPNIYASFLKWDSQGRLWLSTIRDGMYRWNPKTNEQKIYKKELESETPVVIASSIGKAFEDSHQNIWFRRSGGYSVYLNHEDTILNFLYQLQPTHTFDRVLDFVEDEKGRVWVSADRGWYGYALADAPEKGIVQKFDLKSKLPSLQDIYYLRIDLEDNLWLLTNTYLIKLDADDLHPTLFDFQYGLADPNFWCFDILPNGEMVFGMRNKLAICDPVNLRKNTELPQPYLTAINVREQPIESDTIPLFLKHLQLSPKENFFSFDFSALSFTLPEKNRFRYRLQGFDKNWIDARDRRNANFTNVPSGQYIFELQAANNEGVWNLEILQLPISIATPWYKFWWVRLLGLILIAALIFGVYQLRISQIREEERKQSEFQKKLADVEMSALRAQMNPHFIFNCLNSIESYVIKNDTIKAATYLNNFARLIRLILQNSRAKFITLEDEIESLELYLAMESLRFINRFDYQIQVAQDVEVSNLEIPPMLIQPYVENAIWHGLMHKKEAGRLFIEIKHIGNFLYCAIEDNGIGRAKSMEINRRKGRRKKSVGMKSPATGFNCSMNCIIPLQR